MNTSKKIIIIGGNAAGPSAAAKAKRINPNAEVILFEAGEFISTGSCELPYLLSNEIEDYKNLIFYTAESFYKQKNVKVYTNHLVKSIDKINKKIEVLRKNDNDYITFNYDNLILATGSKSKSLKELPTTLTNVFNFKTINDYKKIKKFTVKNKVENILVVGSGYIGLEIADSLNCAGIKVSVLEKEKYPLPSSDIEIQHLINDILINNNIKFLGGDNNSKFFFEDNKFTQLKHNGRFFDYDMVIICVGIEPNNQLATKAGLKTGSFGGLIVDGRLKTTNPSIYAAGDNIEVRNLISRQYDYIPLATLAHEYGHIAGENSVGGHRYIEPTFLNSSFKFCNHFVGQVGLSYKSALKNFSNAKYVTTVANNKVKIMPDSKKTFGKIIYDNYSKSILGASFIGQEEISGYIDIISLMIQNKIPAINLGKINFNYTPPLSPFVNILSILGRKIGEKF